MTFYNSIEELIGHTPIVRLKKLEKVANLKAQLFVKLENFNPSGSIKDRIAKEMLDEAIAQKLINQNTTIIEATSGNTGIALAMLCATRGYPLILTMPDTMSKERAILLKALGAKIILTNGKDGMLGAKEAALKLHKGIPNSYLINQFANSGNVMAHYKTTGPEIYDSLDGQIDYLVVGVGSGGTISGTGKYLKEQVPTIKIIAVEPARSPVLSKNYKGKHNIQGIGAGFIPEILNQQIYDEIIAVDDEEAYQKARMLAKVEGILGGISAGAILHAALLEASLEENTNKKIVAIIPDGGEKYLSTPLFDE